MKKKATKLLAVMAIATSPAVAVADRGAGVDGPVARATDPWAAPRDPWSAPRAIDPDRVRLSLAGLDAAFAMVSARPRQMPSGAPACGNVASRAPRPAECTRPAPAPAPTTTTTTTSEPRLASTTPVRTGDHQ